MQQDVFRLCRQPEQCEQAKGDKQRQQMQRVHAEKAAKREVAEGDLHPVQIAMGQHEAAQHEEEIHRVNEGEIPDDPGLMGLRDLPVRGDDPVDDEMPQGHGQSGDATKQIKGMEALCLHDDRRNRAPFLCDQRTADTG